MSKTIIEVRRNPNEASSSILRRFSRKIQESGIIQKVKGSRYSERKESKLKIKKKKKKKKKKRGAGGGGGGKKGRKTPPKPQKTPDKKKRGKENVRQAEK